MRLLLNFFKIIAALAVALAGVIVYALFAPVSVPKGGAVYYVTPGVSRANLVLGLAENHYVRLAPIFDLYTVLRHRVPKSGEYSFPQGSSPYGIWKQITSGTGRYYRTFIIVPGTTFKQIRTTLQNDPTFKHLINDMTDKDIMAALGDRVHEPEGMFMPESYYYSRGDVDLVILKRAYDLLNLKLNEAWAGRALNLPYQDAYHALIAASLIEKEAYLAKEQPIISGVLVNRLNKNMLLQFDPTVIYGMGDTYQGKIFKSDLTKDTPYNTYLHIGLPPTPIAMTGLGAINAAMHPDRHDYYYFVAAGNGSHTFTTNLQDHNSAVMRARQNANTTNHAGGDHVAS